MADWIRRPFTASGLTPVPTGQHLRALQRRFGGGTVMLCIDVSGSMNGLPLQEAVRGAQQFVSEAVEARYEVGVILWNTDVVGLAEPSADGSSAHQVLAGAQSYGGNALLGSLQRCHQILGNYSGDRVVALFGDGDLTPKTQVLAKVAQMKAENIRFVTRGLGSAAAQEFATVSSEESSNVEVPQVGNLAASIAGMAASLKRAEFPAVARTETLGWAPAGPNGCSVPLRALDLGLVQTGKPVVLNSRSGAIQCLLDARDTEVFLHKVIGACCFADGSWVATADGERTVRVWNSATVQQQALVRDEDSKDFIPGKCASAEWMVTLSRDGWVCKYVTGEHSC